jgi:hypothetical protein
MLKRDVRTVLLILGVGRGTLYPPICRCLKLGCSTCSALWDIGTDCFTCPRSPKTDSQPVVSTDL